MPSPAGSPSGAMGGAYSWYVAIVLGCANTVASIDRTFISLVAEPIRIDLQMTDTQVSLLMGLAYFLIYSVAVIPVAALADHSNRRRIMSVGIFIWSTATAWCGLSTSYLRLFLMRMGVGFGESMLPPSAVSVISDYFARHQLARATAVYTVMGTVGTSLANVLGGLLYRSLAASGDIIVPALGRLHPWQMAFLAISAPGFIVFMLLGTVREPARRHMAQAAPALSPREVRHHIWHHRRAILAVVAGFSMIAASSGVQLWNSILFIRVYGWPIGKIGPILGAVSMVSTLLGVSSGGWCADFLRRRGYEDANLRIILAALAMALPSFLLVPNIGDPIWSVVFLTTAIFSTNVCFGCATPALPLVAPGRMRTQVISLYFFFTNLLSTCITTLVAIITDRVFKDLAAVRLSMTVAYLVLLPGAWAILWFARPAYLAEVRRLRDAEQVV